LRNGIKYSEPFVRFFYKLAALKSDDKMKLRPFFKGIYYFSGIDRLIPSFALRYLGYISSLSKFIRKHKKALVFNDFYTRKFNYDKRFDLFNYVIDKEKISEINYLEFGVSKGQSFRWWVENNTHPESRFYGFDTFTGLPEDWGPFKKGDMSAGKIPVVSDSRHQFYQGLFQQTLPGFLKSFDNSKKMIIHLDADLYTATYFVLNQMSTFLKSGDILFFDEFNVPMHEFKAFTEFVSAYYLDYEVIGAVNNFYQIAIRIK
jgi:O-methyltransferase